MPQEVVNHGRVTVWKDPAADSVPTLDTTEAYYTTKHGILQRSRGRLHTLLS